MGQDKSMGNFRIRVRFVETTQQTRKEMFGGAKKGNDAKFFSDRTVRKGENLELREELRNPKLDRKKDAVKKVSKQ